MKIQHLLIQLLIFTTVQAICIQLLFDPWSQERFERMSRENARLFNPLLQILNRIDFIREAIAILGILSSLMYLFGYRISYYMKIKVFWAIDYFVVGLLLEVKDFLYMYYLEHLEYVHFQIHSQKHYDKLIYNVKIIRNIFLNFMIPRKSSMSKKTIGQPKFILKDDNTLDSSYLEMYQQNKNHNPGQRLQQILQKQINQSQKNKSVEEDRLTRQQFINRSQQVVRQDLGSYTPQNISYDEVDLREENKQLKQQIHQILLDFLVSLSYIDYWQLRLQQILQNFIIQAVRKLQLELQQSKHQNQLLIQDFEQLRDQLEKQSEEFNQAFELINEEKQLIQQEIDQKDQIIAQLRLQLAPPSKTQMQIDEIKNRILARKSVHRSSRENITQLMNDMDQSARQDLKENFMDYNNRITLQKSIK